MAEKRELGCRMCHGEAEPGWIETDNNGPIVPCPFCNSADAASRLERPNQSSEGSNE